MTIPNGVTSINGIFDGCTGLTNVTIPDSVTSIKNLSFRNCASLTSLIIPNSVTSIGDYVFQGCTGLTSIVVEGKTTEQARTLLTNTGLPDINIVTGSIQEVTPA